jgi:hypothetical protein
VLLHIPAWQLAVIMLHPQARGTEGQGHTCCSNCGTGMPSNFLCCMVGYWEPRLTDLFSQGGSTTSSEKWLGGVPALGTRPSMLHAYVTNAGRRPGLSPVVSRLSWEMSDMTKALWAGRRTRVS